MCNSEVCNPWCCKNTSKEPHTPYLELHGLRARGGTSHVRAATTRQSPAHHANISSATHAPDRLHTASGQPASDLAGTNLPRAVWLPCAAAEVDAPAPLRAACPGAASANASAIVHAGGPPERRGAAQRSRPLQRQGMPCQPSQPPPQLRHSSRLTSDYACLPYARQARLGCRPHRLPRSVRGSHAAPQQPKVAQAAAIQRLGQPGGTGQPSPAGPGTHPS